MKKGMNLKDNNSVRLTKHAIQRFIERANIVVFSYSETNPDKTIMKLFSKAQPEIPKNEKTRWELFRRRMMYGADTQTYVYDQWRFVVSQKKNLIITIERVKAHENFNMALRTRQALGFGQEKEIVNKEVFKTTLKCK